MRPFLLLAPLVLMAAPALAEPLAVAKGMWKATSDIYFNVTANGEVMDVPPEHSSIEECWSTDQEVAVDESLVDFFEGCEAVDSWTKAHSIDFELSCDFSGVPMSGTASFAVSKGGNSFVGRMFLAGQTEDGLVMDAEALLLGNRTGACAAPN